MIRFDHDYRRRIEYSANSRGPVRLIVRVRAEHGERSVELDCGHVVARRRVLKGQTSTTCETCKAIANGTRAR